MVLRWCEANAKTAKSKALAARTGVGLPEKDLPVAAAGCRQRQWQDPGSLTTATWACQSNRSALFEGDIVRFDGPPMCVRTPWSTWQRRRVAGTKQTRPPWHFDVGEVN